MLIFILHCCVCMCKRRMKLSFNSIREFIYLTYLVLQEIYIFRDHEDDDDRQKDKFTWDERLQGSRFIAQFFVTKQSFLFHASIAIAKHNLVILMQSIIESMRSTKDAFFSSSLSKFKVFRSVVTSVRSLPVSFILRAYLYWGFVTSIFASFLLYGLKCFSS